MQRIGRSANILKRPSNGRDSAGLNWIEVQRGHIRRGHNTRGSHPGQFAVSALIRGSFYHQAYIRRRTMLDQCRVRPKPLREQEYCIQMKCHRPQAYADRTSRAGSLTLQDMQERSVKTSAPWAGSFTCGRRNSRLTRARICGIADLKALDAFHFRPENATAERCRGVIYMAPKGVGVGLRYHRDFFCRGEAQQLPGKALH
jgi:hypothetical protein